MEVQWHTGVEEMKSEARARQARTVASGAQVLELWTRWAGIRQSHLAGGSKKYDTGGDRASWQADGLMRSRTR